jgi:hypothetical protein
MVCFVFVKLDEKVFYASVGLWGLYYKDRVLNRK